MGVPVRMLITLAAVMMVVSSSLIQTVAASGMVEYEEMSTEDVLYIRCIISSVSVEKMEISVRPLKAERVTVAIGPDTEMEGFESIDELAKKQQVKVWYAVVDGANIALKVVKLMELGC